MIQKPTQKHKNGTAVTVDPAAPMPAAPMKYLPDGTVDWGNMWDTFCVLAQAGGPPHRGVLLTAPPVPDVDDPRYAAAVHEICRGVAQVSGLTAVPGPPGWVQITCHTPGMARWLREAIREENVDARHEREYLFVPAGETFALKGEIKSVITAVAKTTHYWQAHLAQEVKHALTVQDGVARIRRWFRRKTASPQLFKSAPRQK